MRKQIKDYLMPVAMSLLLLTLSSSATLAQEDKPAKQQPTGTPVLWRDPGDIAAKNLVAGPGGEEMKPDTSNLTFIEEDASGFSYGMRVRDGAGKTWVVKLGKEAQPETSASRLLWAVGYITEIHYLYPCIQVKGAPGKPAKSVPRCEGQGFANARFEARPEGIKRLDEWTWANNPFAGTREMKGLIVLMALINNWDLKDSNNKVIYVPANITGGQDELQYILSDLGATFGKTGGFLSRSRNAAKDYAKSKFITGVQGNNVKFAYSGKNQALMNGITVEDARWIGGLLSKLTDEQIQDAFRAGNFTPEEVQMLSQAVRGKIGELTRL
jgi:hypothetical protein